MKIGEEKNMKPKTCQKWGKMVGKGIKIENTTLSNIFVYKMYFL
jgi:hypothetical protein